MILFGQVGKGVPDQYLQKLRYLTLYSMKQKMKSFLLLLLLGGIMGAWKAVGDEREEALQSSEAEELCH